MADNVPTDTLIQGQYVTDIKIKPKFHHWTATTVIAVNISH